MSADINFPVVLKALGIAHKTEKHAVRLGIESQLELERVAIELFEIGDRLLVEEMVDGIIAELIVGVTRDPQFGLVLTIGSGGVLVEILKDIQTFLIPANREEVEQAVLNLKSVPLLQGYRGKPKADLAAAVDAIMTIQQYALSVADRLVELDVNPLLLCAEGKGAYAADALIVLEEK